MRYTGQSERPSSRDPISAMVAQRALNFWMRRVELPSLDPSTNRWFCWCDVFNAGRFQRCFTGIEGVSVGLHEGL